MNEADKIQENRGPPYLFLVQVPPIKQILQIGGGIKTNPKLEISQKV